MASVCKRGCVPRQVRWSSAEGSAYPRPPGVLRAIDEERIASAAVSAVRRRIERIPPERDGTESTNRVIDDALPLQTVPALRVDRQATEHAGLAGISKHSRPNPHPRPVVSTRSRTILRSIGTGRTSQVQPVFPGVDHRAQLDSTVLLSANRCRESPTRQPHRQIPDL